MENNEGRSTAETKIEDPSDPYNIPAPGYFPEKKPARWTALDLARGFAIILMIVSHCVKGLMVPSRIPDWGIVPVHLITKFSSSLFILVFGMSLSLFFIPQVGTRNWSKKRNWLLFRSLELMFWYKVLTIVQMFQFYPRGMIIETLWFKRLPDFVEILSFYSIALLWIPFFLPVWKKLNLLNKTLTIAVTFGAGQWLHYNFDFWQMDTLKALIVEHDDYYSFGQFQRGALVFLGLLIGDFYKMGKEGRFPVVSVPMACFSLGLTSLAAFLIRNQGKIYESLKLVAKNIGKHPFETDFFLFSVGGALTVMGLSMLMSERARSFLNPITYIGKNSLMAFNLHIIIIFYFYRFYFDLHHNVNYTQALYLTLGCVLGINVILFIWAQIKEAFK